MTTEARGVNDGGHWSGVDDIAAATGVEWAAIGVGLGKVTPAVTLTVGSGLVIIWSNQTRLGSEPNVAQGHRMLILKISLSSTGVNE